MNTNRRYLAVLGLAGLVAALLAALFVTDVLALGPGPYKLPARWEYAVKFACGSRSGQVLLTEAPDALDGSYATLVNIHNPGPQGVVMTKKIALTSANPGPIVVTPTVRFEDKLGVDFAMKIGCAEITRILLETNHYPINVTWVEGYLIIDSAGPQGRPGPELDVDAVYTVGPTPDQSSFSTVTSFQVLHVPGRRLPGGTWAY